MFSETDAFWSAPQQLRETPGDAGAWGFWNFLLWNHCSIWKYRGGEKQAVMKEGDRDGEKKRADRKKHKKDKLVGRWSKMKTDRDRQFGRCRLFEEGAW